MFKSSLFISVLFSLFLFSCDDSSDNDSTVAFSADEVKWFAERVPAAEKKRVYNIPEDKLNETDTAFNNTTFMALYDGSGTLLGYARQVASDVACATGECSAVRFFLVYDADINFTMIFHPEDTSGAFYKGLDTYESGEEEPFTQDDWDTLNSILSNPEDHPDLLSAADENEIVDATSTATYEKYTDDVVRYAAYTTYLTLTYMIDTKAIISDVVE